MLSMFQDLIIRGDYRQSQSTPRAVVVKKP
jgi:hypothetical protein